MDEQKKLKRSLVMYNLEAGLEYLISLLVASSFLATLTKDIGISDSITGIISSFISLGCLFQLLSLLVHRRKVKPIVIALSITNQLLFMMLYIIPLWGGSDNTKTVMFTATIFIAYILYYFAHPKKINWFMSLVDDKIRGRFTANKEIMSLIMGMIFTLIMSAVVDYFKDSGRTHTAFIICAAVMFVIMIAHTLSMIFAIEKPNAPPKEHNIIKNMLALVKDKTVLKVTAVFVIWYIANYASLPFYGTYMINELGFSLKYVSVLSIAQSVIRILVSHKLGSYADRNSFAAMLKICFGVMCAGFVFAMIATPSNGMVMFLLYNLCAGIANGGISSALANLIFDYVPPEKRADSLALCQSCSGVAGFLSTLVMSPVVEAVQENGNRILGLPIYAQQFASFIALIFTAATIFYIHFVLQKSTPRHI